MILQVNQKETPFDVRDNAIDLRQAITELSFRRFGKKARTIPNTPSNWEQWSEISRNRWLEDQEQKRVQAEEFDNWFIQNERTILDRLLRRIIYDIDAANIMQPQYLFEYEKQRELQDDAIAYCSNLKRELNYIGETIPANKNFIVKVVGIIERELALLRGWRKFCNKNRAKVIDDETPKQG